MPHPWRQPRRDYMNTHQGHHGRGSNHRGIIISMFKMSFTCGKGGHPITTPHAHQPLCQLTHRRILTDQQVCVKEVVGEEGQSVHLAWKLEKKSISQVPSCQFHAFCKGRRVEATAGTDPESGATAPGGSLLCLKANQE